MKEIPLTKGYTAIVDDEDYERLSVHKWHAAPSGSKIVAARKVYRTANTRTQIHLHHAVMGIEGSSRRTMVTAKNGNFLDCQKVNLVVSHALATAKGPKLIATNSSGYRGVSWSAAAKKWKAQLCVSGRNPYLGVFDTPEDAARAYDRAVGEVFGELATTNFD